MRRALATAALVFAACLPASGASGAVRAWKRAHHDLDDRRGAFQDALQRRLTDVYQQWTGLRQLWRGEPEAFKDEVVPLDGLRAIYADAAALETSAKEIDDALAASGDADAVETLVDALMDLAKETDRTEKELAESRPTGRDSRYEQETSLLRRGQALRLAGLVGAIARAPGAAAFLEGEGYEDATKGDKNRSTIRTSAVLDALGRIGDDSAVAFLRERLADERPFVRIVALENLVSAGGLGDEDRRSLLADPAPPVRRALLETLAGSGRPAAIPVLVGRMVDTRGLERERLIRALVALTGEDRGNDPSSWKAWLDAHADAIAAGTFERPATEKAGSDPDGASGGDPGKGDDAGKKDAADAETAKPVEAEGPPLHVAPALEFYGMPLPSARAVFVVEGSSGMLLPADLPMQRRFSKRHWYATRPQWHDAAIDHRDLLLEQLEMALGRAPESARIGLVHLFGATPSRVDVFGDRGLIEPTRSHVKSLLRQIDKPSPAGQLSVEEGLRRAFDLSGLDPFENPKKPDETAEIVVVVDGGWQGGRWPLPELVTEAFARRNRFYRLAACTIRIRDEKAEAEAMMRGLARVSGGWYRWVDALPPAPGG